MVRVLTGMEVFSLIPDFFTLTILKIIFEVSSEERLSHVPKFYQICIFVTAKKAKSGNLERLRFLQNVTNRKSGREIVMENQEMVM